MTFLEIILAVCILVISVMPIFVLLNRDVEETDVNASEAFAAGKASEVLNTLLDQVPFEFIRQGQPFGYLCSSDIKNHPSYKAQWSDDAVLQLMARSMFGDQVKAMSGGWECRGVVPDPRGIHYLVRVGVEDLPSVSNQRKPEDRPANGLNNPFPTANELTFSFMLNPAALETRDYQGDYSKPAYNFEGKTGTPPFGRAGEPGIAVSEQDLWVKEADYAKKCRRYFQFGCVEPVNYNTADPSGKRCAMKRLICEVQWNLDRNLFTQPDKPGPKLQRLHIITIKADLDR